MSDKSASCDQICSPDDWCRGGKCHINGCYEPKDYEKLLLWKQMEPYMQLREDITYDEFKVYEQLRIKYLELNTGIGITKQNKNMELFENINKGAEFSNDGLYRYRLWRIWDESKPKAMVVGLNPSTANAEKDDATISILKRMLAILGYGGFYMMNCFAYITSKPELLKHNPISDEWNNNMLTVTAGSCADIILAYGGFKVIKEKGRDKELIEMFPNAKCFGKSKDGSPIHPLAMQERNGRNPNKPELFPYN